MIYSDIMGAVICGGKSSRFGSDKRLYIYNNQTLLDTSFQKLCHICSETVCVFRDPPPQQFIGYPHVYDDLSIEGPMSGLVAALKYSKKPYVFILPCDVPCVSIDFLKLIASQRRPDTVIIPETDRLEPLIGIYPKSFYSDLKNLAKASSYSLKDFVLNLNDKRKNIVKIGNDSYQNISMYDFENINCHSFSP